MNSMAKPPPNPIRGRGARDNIDHRFSRCRVELAAAECERLSDEPAHPATRVTPVRARSVITRNQSPDVGFNRSLNPYQGCEHGCVYCFARPSHAYHDLSPGLDFETRILAKTNVVERFRAELSKPSYRCAPIAIGVNTDAYQPAERRLELTRGVLETCLDFRQPLVLITKSALVLRDLDLLSALAEQNLVRISISVTTLDDELKRRLEPRTAGPAPRLKLIRRLAGAGVPVCAMVAPVIPRINDHELEDILAAVAEAGARSASYVFLRLPHEVAPLFRDWLAAHYPQRAGAVMNAVRASRGGLDYRARYHERMKGSGLLAEMIRKRFEVARRRYGLAQVREDLDTTAFRVPGAGQQDLFE